LSQVNNDKKTGKVRAGLHGNNLLSLSSTTNCGFSFPWCHPPQAPSETGFNVMPPEDDAADGETNPPQPGCSC
jgi:hypothetical protein